MIYGFAKQSGGQARIYSEIGQGTTVKMYLPRHHGQARPNENAAQDSEQLPRAETGETVLVVDDEPTVRMLVGDTLADLGYRRSRRPTRLRASRCSQSDVKIDLLITDVGLPGGMNGKQMADAARVHRPALKVLFITGYAENATISNGHLEARHARPEQAVPDGYAGRSHSIDHRGALNSAGPRQAGRKPHRVGRGPAGHRNDCDRWTRFE